MKRQLFKGLLGVATIIVLGCGTASAHIGEYLIKSGSYERSYDLNQVDVGIAYIQAYKIEAPKVTDDDKGASMLLVKSGGVGLKGLSSYQMYTAKSFVTRKNQKRSLIAFYGRLHKPPLIN